jgi:hypothetical protein
VIDRHPIEFRSEILLDLGHQPARQRLQIIIFATVLGGDDEPELMAVAIRAVDERLAVGTVLVGGIEVTGQTLARDAIALDIAQVRTGSLQPLACQA